MLPERDARELRRRRRQIDVQLCGRRKDAQTKWGDTEPDSVLPEPDSGGEMRPAVGGLALRSPNFVRYVCLKTVCADLLDFRWT